MKIALSIISTLFCTTGAFAGSCPTLSGAYKNCQADTQISDFQVDMINIKQSMITFEITTVMKNGTSTTEKMVADGQPVSSVENDPELGKVTNTMQTTCENNQVVSIGTVKADQFNFSTKTTVFSTATGIEMDSYLESSDQKPAVVLTCVHE
jgi:hypothetical protein